MREYLEQLSRDKRNIQVYFPAAAANKLVALAGTINQVGDDYIILHDIYANAMFIPIASITYIEVRK